MIGTNVQSIVLSLPSKIYQYGPQNSNSGTSLQTRNKFTWPCLMIKFKHMLPKFDETIETFFADME